MLKCVSNLILASPTNELKHNHPSYYTNDTKTLYIINKETNISTNDEKQLIRDGVFSAGFSLLLFNQMDIYYPSLPPGKRQSLALLIRQNMQ